MNIRFLSFFTAVASIYLVVSPVHAEMMPTSVDVVTVAVAPNAPSDLTAVSTAPTQVALTWTDNSGTENGFDVERKTGAGGTYAEIAATGANIATYTDNAVAAATLYFYRVRAFTGTNYSPYSNEASAATAYTPPPPPSNFIVLATTTSPGGSVSATTTDMTAASVTSNGIGISISIPTGTAITGSSSWDGTVILPQATTTFTAPTADPGYTASAITAIAVGASDSSLELGSAARLLFAGQTGKLVGWSLGGAFTPIRTICSADTQAAGDALSPGGDCKFDNGADLIVWTKHFTSYVIYTETVIPPVVAPPSNPPSNGGGGGGGGGGAPAYTAPVSDTNVTITGDAYPLGKVVILKDGQIAVQTIAGPNGVFTASVANLSGGSYIFSVYGEDDAGQRSTLFTFPVIVTVGATTEIGGVFLSPIIDVDKETVKQDDTIAIFGKTIPDAIVTIQVDSTVPHFVNTTSSASGAYLYEMNTAQLEYGSHVAKSEVSYGNQISDYSVSRGFTVGDHTVLVPQAPAAPTEAQGDLNGDGSINLVDFSILAYWYGQPNPPAGYLLDGGTVIDLRDFSIMVYYWTG